MEQAKGAAAWIALKLLKPAGFLLLREEAPGFPAKAVRCCRWRILIGPMAGMRGTCCRLFLDSAGIPLPAEALVRPMAIMIAFWRSTRLIGLTRYPPKPS